MRRQLVLLMILTIPLLSFLPLPEHVVYMPLIYRQGASEPACQGHILGTVYDDVDGDGQRDANEVGLPGIRLTIRSHYSPDVTTAITDGSGQYLLTVPPGQYELHADRPSGYRWTTAHAWGVDLVCATIPLNFGLQPIGHR
ncbi:MAG: SdrD B-like domain-containing protein [Anaerolineae bacterium]